MSTFPWKAAVLILIFAVAMLALGAAKWIRPADYAAVVDFHPRPETLPAIPEVRSARPVKADGRTPANPNKIPLAPESTSAYSQLSDPPGALTSFYQALWRTESKQGVTRILHYGDSPVTADSITADMRSLMQERFGDAGHGFVLVAKPWAWYGHRGVSLRGKGWRNDPASQAGGARDRYHGLGGVSFRGESGANAQIHLDSPHTRIEVHYLSEPGGGTLAIRVGDQDVGEIPTAADAKKPGFASFTLPPQTDDVRLIVTSGSVRLFGVSFTKDASGVIYNSLGLNGAGIQTLLRYFEPNQWAEELQHERPDLVVLNYGTNEASFASYIDRYYASELREVIRRVKADVPNASVLVMGPMDRGERDRSGEIVTLATLPKIVAIQKDIAAETGCAFFNTFQAMGGEGTMSRWYHAQPRLVNADYMHPLPGGARKVGTLLFDAVTAGYERFKGSHQIADSKPEAVK